MTREMLTCHLITIKINLCQLLNKKIVKKSFITLLNINSYASF